MFLLRLWFEDVAVEISKILIYILIQVKNLKFILFHRFFNIIAVIAKKQFLLHFISKCQPMTPPMVINRNYDLQKKKHESTIISRKNSVTFTQGLCGSK